MKNVWQTMRDGGVTAGTFVVSASPAAVEIVGYSGPDFVVIDCEHAALSPYGTELEGCVRAAYAADVTPIVRTTSKEGAQVLKAANFGAHGVLVPHVNTAEELEGLISYAKLPLMGNRSCAPPVRAARYGWTAWPEFYDWTNDTVEIVPILEEPRAFERLDELLDVPGLKFVCHGPYDLAARLGGIGDAAAEQRVEELLLELIEKCEPRGISVLNLAWNAEQARHQVDVGCRGIIYSTDVSLLNAALVEQWGNLRKTLSLPREAEEHASIPVEAL